MLARFFGLSGSDAIFFDGLGLLCVYNAPKKPNPDKPELKIED
jgi:hypothetical protein